MSDTKARAMLKDANIVGADANTCIHSFVRSVLQPHSDRSVEALENLGLRPFDSDGRFVGADNLVDQLAHAAERSDREGYDAATVTLFGADAMRLAALATPQH